MFHGLVSKIKENLVTICKDFKSVGFLPSLNCRLKGVGVCGGVRSANDVILLTDINVVKLSISEPWFLVQSEKVK